MKQLLSEYRLFFREFLLNYHTTGAVLPSGRRLATALASYVGKSGSPQRILEVGPGTGAVTRRIIAAMRAEDRLDLVELNESFVGRLRERLRTEPLFRAVSDRVRIFHCPVEDLAQDRSYDVIVSGLPLNNFETAEVQRILDALSGLLVPGGILSFFQYIAIRRVKALVTGREGRKRLRGIGEVLGRVLEQGEVRRDWIWPNVPPAWVHHVQFDRRGP
jgi:phosphatidylethanolamine/phosphatidyl-N-methylethanolamine N-methyltransferase